MAPISETLLRYRRPKQCKYVVVRGKFRHLSMRLLLTCASAVYLSCSAVADEEIVFEFPAQVANECVTYSISRDELDRMPEWRPENENPPLSARSAMRIAIRIVDRKTKSGEIQRYNNASWRVQRLALRDIGERKWLWIIVFELEPEPGTGATGIPSLCEIAISMKGDLIRSSIDPDDVEEEETEEESVPSVRGKDAGPRRRGR